MQNDDLYKEDQFFIEVLNSGDRKRQCEYRNATVNAIVRIEKFQDNDAAIRVASRVYNIQVVLNVILIVDVMIYIGLVLYTRHLYNSGALTEFWRKLFSVYCGEGGPKSRMVMLGGLIITGLNLILSRNKLNNAIRNANNKIEVAIEPDVVDLEILKSIHDNSYPELVVKRDALDGVLWGNNES
ncbi:hypothetical protein IJG79_03180 [Candidatus Saccharibacteria bacterium]|nr:hypothetical protein [Candidatus Saccharibacteria bacterium]